MRFRTLLMLAVLATVALVACAPRDLGLVTATAGPALEPTASLVPTLPALPTCNLSPITVPVLPDEIPGYTEVDPATGLHMTGNPQVIDLESYRLEITGSVERTLSLTYDQLRCLPKVEAGPELVCPGFFVDEASWSGALIEDVLALAGVKEGPKELRLLSADGYAVTVSLEEVVSKGGFLAYQWEDDPLPVLHGFPVRAVLPGVTGGKWVKWLVSIEVRPVGMASATEPLP